MTDISKVAVYGLGNMGFPLARRIAARFAVQVFDLNQDMLATAGTEFGAETITGPEALSQTPVVVLCLPSPKVSLAVLRQIAPHLPKDAVVVETSTVNPEDVIACRDVLAPFGIRVIDASLMAGVSQMEAGTASLLIGGEEAAIAVCKPVLDAIAEKQTVFGALGTGAAAKVINNAVAHAVMVVVAEAGSMATATGVSIDKLVGLLSDPQMGLHRPLTYRFAKRVVEGDYAGGMPLDAARKDSRLALDLAQTESIPLFAIQAAHSVYEMAARAGYAREDYAVIAKLWEDWHVPAVPK
ncbi:NAD(P)-dependent oxidoreductase [Stappia sp. ES.058]|uniref:NAD(P)-dependent oxidoreductase n=1 Tax=Stappia sp. ES.058 TaxID=1881061 RepID=UPI00087BE988|nr:NAD(P)-dependent oxidoreductase [Stappia sp. ES.058]SDU15229.1 3-hydroxyisobutyrate dehydrogenase [Stappia sp. ES.058]